MNTGPIRLRTRQLAIGHNRKSPLMQGIGIDLFAGELTALVGVNGVGKSTLLRTMAGLQNALAGEVLLNGQPLQGMRAAERARNLAMVLTGRPRTGNLNVESLVALGRHPWTDRWGNATQQDREVVDQALWRTGILHMRKKKVDTCSDGEYQKVLIARALAQDTPVILLDEPTAFLDLPNRAEVVRTLHKIAHDQETAILFSSHDLQLVLDLCDRVILLRPAHEPWTGTPRQALQTGILAEAFSGSGVVFDQATGTHRFQR